jgi:prepilin-type N-terminal cleavage/methylation domain-containing protein
MVAQQHKAFSLAELTITLAILGTLAVSLLPMISNSQAGPRKYTATLKSTMATIENGLVSTMGKYQDNIFKMFTTTLKAEKICLLNSATEGCWNTALQTNGNTYVADQASQSGFVLKNGVQIVGLNNSAAIGSEAEIFMLLDANGVEGPNQLNVDQLFLWLCTSAEDCNDMGGTTGYLGLNINPLQEYKVTTGGFMPAQETWIPGSRARFNEIME